MAKRNPTILIHGIDDTGVLFGRLLAFLEAQGWSVHNLELVPNDGRIGIDSLAAQLCTYITSTFSDNQALDLVGFSMGGLVARYYVQRMAEAGRVDRLITISSPHRGTWTAFFRRNAGARQMRPGSDFLNDLSRDSDVLRRVRFTSIWSPLDLMIVPATSSLMPEANSIRVTVVAHAFMMRDARVLRLVQRALSC